MPEVISWSPPNARTIVCLATSPNTNVLPSPRLVNISSRLTGHNSRRQSKRGVESVWSICCAWATYAIRPGYRSCRWRHRFCIYSLCPGRIARTQAYRRGQTSTWLQEYRGQCCSCWRQRQNHSSSLKWSLWSTSPNLLCREYSFDCPSCRLSCLACTNASSILSCSVRSGTFPTRVYV